MYTEYTVRRKMFREGEIISLLEKLAENLEHIQTDVSVLKNLQKSTDSTISAIARELLDEAELETVPPEGEVWEPLPMETFGKKYMVSNMGRVKVVKGKFPGKILNTFASQGSKSASQGSKRLRVALGYRQNRTTRFVDWLVAKAFVPPYKGTSIAHLDGNINNNRADNLKWQW